MIGRLHIYGNLASFIGMLHSCACHTRGQGDGRDVNVRDLARGSLHLLKSLKGIHSASRGHAYLDSQWQLEKGRRYREWAHIAHCGRSRKWGHAGSSRPGFKLGVAAIPSLGYVG